MTRVAVVAPASFGDAAARYLDGAAEALADHDAHYALIGARDDLQGALALLDKGDIVLGSLSSELGADVARLAVDRELIHVEAGAVGDDVLAGHSFRLTPGKVELARAAAEVAVGRRVGVVVEASAFGHAMGQAVATELSALETGIDGESELDEVLDCPSEWQHRYRVDVVVAALRGGLPEKLLDALTGLPRPVEVVGAGGSWTTTEVGRLEARGDSPRLVFCEVIAPRMSADDVDHGLYRDLGRAAATVVARVLATRRPVREQFFELVIDKDESPLGYGVRFDSDGRNELARAAVLQWKHGRIVSYEPGGAL